MVKPRKTETGAPTQRKAPEKFAVQSKEKQLLLPFKHAVMLLPSDVVHILGTIPPSEPSSLSLDMAVSNGQLRLELFERKARDSSRFEHEEARRTGEVSKQRHLDFGLLLRTHLALSPAHP